MATEYFLINDSSNWEAVEAICKRFPQFDVEPSFTWEKKQNKHSDKKTWIMQTPFTVIHGILWLVSWIMHVPGKIIQQDLTKISVLST